MVQGLSSVPELTSKSSTPAIKYCSADKCDRNQMFEMVHLTKGAEWAFDKENSVGLPGAHSSEIVRSFCFYDEAQMVFSVGEDGYIKSWKAAA